MALHRVAFSPAFEVSVGGGDDCEYNAQSNRRDLRLDVPGLSGCRSGHPRNPRAHVSRLIGRDDMASN
ncbi:hypothetical protein GW17_00028648 [Ensete ventricosum]|nr:hypothetical protein GW17_00028648 [Ensete ventricosum]